MKEAIGKEIKAFGGSTCKDEEIREKKFDYESLLTGEPV